MRDCDTNSEEKFKVLNSFGQQAKNYCWALEKPESTISLGSRLTKMVPNLRILLLNGPLGAGKTTLVKGIAQSLKIKDPITSPTFPLSQHYPLGSPPLIHIDLYRIEEASAANEFFLQEEEESKAMGALMVVEWPERLSLPMNDAWRGKLEYSSINKARFFQLMPPFDKDNNLLISSR